MILPALLVADTHFTDAPSDEYRWGLWPWLREQIVQERIKTVNLLGDLTNAKDHHSAELTNRMAREIRQTAAMLQRFNLMPGNHDWLRDGHEFFRFLGMLPNVRHINVPSEDDVVAGPSAYFLPFNKNPSKAWKGMNFEEYDYLFMHQTIKGAVASNGEEMGGEELPDLSSARKIYSGDIHVPQTIGPIEYVGSPYHVHFGDQFRGRCVLLEKNGRPIDLHFDTIQRITLKVQNLRQLRKADLTKGDQVKLRVELEPSEKHEWKILRREAIGILKEAQVEVHGVELIIVGAGQERRFRTGDPQSTHRLPADDVTRWVRAEELGADALDIGLEILEP